MTEDTSPENLRKFLESDDPALVMMGLSMAKGSGVPEEILGEILWMYMLHDDKTIRAAAKSIFIKFAPEDAKQAVKENWKATYRSIDSRGLLLYPELIRNLEYALNSTAISLVGPLRKLVVPPYKSNTILLEFTAQIILGEIGDKRALKPLIKMLENNNDVKWRQFPHNTTYRNMNAAHKVGQSKAALALGKLGDVRAVEPLIKALKSESVVSGGSAVALGMIKDSRAINALIKALETHASRDASWALVEMGEYAVDSLIKALRNENIKSEYLIRWRKEREELTPREEEQIDEALGWRRFFIIMTLGQIGDVRAAEPIAKMLVDEKDYVRAEVVKALEKLGWEPETDELRASLLIFKLDVDALVNWGEPAVVPLIKALEGENYQTGDLPGILAIAEALGKIGDSRAVEPLIKVLGNFNPADFDFFRDCDVRLNAIIALGEIGDERAVEPLIEVLSDNNNKLFGERLRFENKVRKAAKNALRKLGHEVE